jgi:hypothetical protein
MRVRLIRKVVWLMALTSLFRRIPFARSREISIRTEAGEERRRIRADRLMLKVGVAYSVF